MDFIGTNGVPAPLLKDVPLSESKARELYLECILMTRDLYMKAKLVHADLSEFNILYHEGSLVLIDVSQSVEHDHPRALDFLRKDCFNVNAYFRKNLVPTLSLRELFDFVTDPTISANNIDDYLTKAQDIASKRTLDDLTEQEKVEEEVFKQIYIPKRLDEVDDYEKDVAKVQKGGKVIYQTITAMNSSLSGPASTPSLLQSNQDESAGSGSSEENSDEGNKAEEDRVRGFVTSARPRDESPNTKKERKAALKEDRKKKLKEKVPKHIKKRKDRLGRSS